MNKYFIKFSIFVLILVFWTNLGFANNNEYLQTKKIIMIDLDGVLNNYTGYDKDKMPKLKKGAKDFLETLSNEYILILFTSRNLKSTAKWLINNDIDKYFTDITNVKRPAYLYIDDRALNFNRDYTKTLDDINKFQTYWNRQ